MYGSEKNNPPNANTRSHFTGNHTTHGVADENRARSLQGQVFHQRLNVCRHRLDGLDTAIVFRLAAACRCRQQGDDC